VENLEKVIYKEAKPLPLKDIYVSESNVRHTEQYDGIDELINSIKKFGLIHPVIVMEDKGRYELIVGQRRFIAFQQMKEKMIPAIIIEKLNAQSKTVVSFAENIHRRELDYNDTIAVCQMLFEKYAGNKRQKVAEISRDLGIGIPTVSKYLGYKLIPEEVRNLVDENKINRKQAEQITIAFWPNTKKILAVVKELVGRTRTEWKRALNYTKKHPTATPKEIAIAAETPETTIKMILEIDTETLVALKEIAKRRTELLEREVDTHELIEEAITEFITKEGSDGRKRGK
jgi:ParB/RepB/Spo0J family partition protein